MTGYPVHIPDLPSEEQTDRIVALTDPLARITQPKVYGVEHIPDGGSLLVGNHTIYGFLDLPFMMAEIWKRRRLVVRGLGEHAHYAVPVWRDVLGMCGMVRGTRENVRALMREGETVLVFPGGAREVQKGRGEKYQLIWKERVGFARLAIEHGYPVIPFAAVGAEEMLDVVIGNTDPVYGQISGLVEKLTRSKLFPVVRGIGPTPIPRPERLYFWFGEPIDTTRFEGRHDDDEAARTLRDETKAAIDGGIAFLQDARENDPHRSVVRRVLSRDADS